MLSTTSSVACSASAALDRQDGTFQVVERGHGVIRPHKLAAEGIEHRGGVAVGFHRDERGAAHLLRADHPAGELGGERGLAFAALAAHHGVARPPHPWPLSPRCGRGEGERRRRWSASSSRLRPMKPVSGAGGSSPRRAASVCTEVRHRLLRGRGLEELRVLLLLEEHGHEPILEPQRTRAEDAAAEGVVLEPRVGLPAWRRPRVCPRPSAS